VNNKKETVSLRKALHTLGNRHHIGILVPGFIRQALEICLKNRQLPGEVKRKLEKILTDLANLETAGREADILLKQIKQVLYDKLDPDSVLIEIEGIEAKDA